MILFLKECLTLAICCGLIAAVYRNILAYERVLNWWFRFGNRFENSWFYPPIWGCIYCISGQFGLWSFVFIKGLSFSFINIFGWIFCICTAIFFGNAFQKLIKIINQD